MYNEEIKKQFIAERAHTDKTKQTYNSIFERVSKFEEEFGEDLCAMPEDHLQKTIEDFAGLKTRSQIASVHVLRDYSRWCVIAKINGANKNMLHIKTYGSKKMKTQTVSSPYHLQCCLNDLYFPEDEKNPDILYRCYLWLVYAGMKGTDITKLKSSNVNLAEGFVEFNGVKYTIYGEARKTLHICTSDKSFYYKNSNYSSKGVWRNRVAGNELLRGIRGKPNESTIRNEISRRATAMFKAGKTSVQLSYHRVELSGLFYRTYEMERIGIKPDFTKFIEDQMSGKEYKTDPNHSLETKKRDYINLCKLDYERWKIAHFN